MYKYRVKKEITNNRLIDGSQCTLTPGVMVYADNELHPSWDDTAKLFTIRLEDDRKVYFLIQGSLIDFLEPMMARA